MLSRRRTLAALAVASLACQRRRRPLRVSSVAAGSSGFVSGGLEVVSAGTMPDEERGGAAVVLLHGWGAPGHNLLGLARALDRPRTRFFVPAGPLEADRGRAW